ncbi:DeoR/GlpR family DNA-binding transcription regulator [uncultured Nitratireductor sp.]|uniref:DeoR/GlpR family DNA-binding transcription regulator n=1 Tax=uncultured Nitratireductor sp. TaxID=520953 RepID=UPI0025D02EF3|nr:DeoR/GlpR family DNA-binding transcription regulator [uncultured Nitratireductor sp.]
MARPSGRAARIEALRKLCASGTILHIAEAAQELKTSEITIRRDLGDGENGILCLGGYIMSANEKGERYSLSHAQGTNTQAKAQVAKQAAAMVVPEDTIFLDCGSTLQYLAANVPQNANVTVVTQAMNVAEIISRLEGVSLILLAGIYHPESGSFSSDTALKMLQEINVTKGFFSAAGIHENEGVTCFHFHEVAAKRAAMARSQRRFLVSDPSKWGRLRPATFAQLNEFETWIGKPGAD